MEKSSATEEQGKKRDIKALLAVIPPPTALRKTTRPGAKERRIRIRHRDDVKRNEAIINPQLASEIKATNQVEVVVAGKKKFIFNIIINEKVPINEIWCNSELLKTHGIADNSIATVRGK